MQQDLLFIIALETLRRDIDSKGPYILPSFCTFVQTSTWKLWARPLNTTQMVYDLYNGSIKKTEKTNSEAKAKGWLRDKVHLYGCTHHALRPCKVYTHLWQTWCILIRGEENEAIDQTQKDPPISRTPTLHTFILWCFLWQTTHKPCKYHQHGKVQQDHDPLAELTNEMQQRRDCFGLISNLAARKVTSPCRHLSQKVVFP